MAKTPPVALVTGASRGAGKGIATALGVHGCTVYVTGRSQQAGDSSMPGTIFETAELVTKAGGNGIAVRCDHSDDDAVAALFARIAADHGGLDILVNNAAAIQDELTMPGNFWEKPLRLSQLIDVGIRSSYVASWHAVPIMIKRGRGLIVFTSASGAVHYALGPAYGAHKAALDKMSFDMATEFEDAAIPISAVSIWMGAVLTDRLKAVIASDRDKFGGLEAIAETPEFTGHLVWALWNDPKAAELSGQTLIGAELASRYGITDADGRVPPSYRDTHQVAPHANYPVKIR